MKSIFFDSLMAIREPAPRPNRFDFVKSRIKTAAQGKEDHNRRGEDRDAAAMKARDGKHLPQRGSYQRLVARMKGTSLRRPVRRQKAPPCPERSQRQTKPQRAPASVMIMGRTSAFHAWKVSTYETRK